MPYAQGELDGLCGVYAIVNAVEATVAGWNKTDAEGLFRHLTSYLQRQRHAAMTDGIGLRDLCQLIDRADKHLNREYGLRMRRRIAFATRTSLSCYWQRLGRHLEGEGCSVIAGLDGIYRHWTCIRAVRPRELVVSDSGRYPIQRLYRAYCTTGRQGRRKRHQLSPMQSVLLMIEVQCG